MVYDFKKIQEIAKKVWIKYSKEIGETLKDDKKKKLFSFLEGPPTANAPPGLHHLEVRVFKDIICKFKYMQGFSVPRKGGWDCHGLPVEVQVEKKIGLNSKKEILKYGKSKFIEKCRESVFSNIKDWNDLTKEINYLIDLKNPYKTLDNNYIESVWWSLKELYKKKLLYKDYKVLPYCPRCGTPLSSHEVAQGYKNIKEESVYIAFKLKNKGEYILAWTTTPWTLPGNVALAVGKKIKYVKILLPDKDTLILGKEKLNIIQGDYKILKEYSGKDLIGLSYEPLFNIKELQNKNSHKIISADFVTTEEGTGIVHTAGMYGEEDYTLCKSNNLPMIHTVDEEGKFNKLVPEFQGKFVKDVETQIKINLKKQGLLFKTEKTEHTYPFCWRCNSPLLYYAIKSWFIKTTAVKNKLIELNKKINWLPKHIREGRFGLWLENLKDWSLSRFKFWGTPLPIWECECGKERIIGSVKELKKESLTNFKDYDLHKPWIDNIKLKCECGKEMLRTSEVIDCWYDSGSASFAQFHYPFENKKEFEKRFPYDFISEAIDQTRGWFYTLHAISTMLFENLSYKNVICAGHILDEKGEKMSKSKGNIIEPLKIINNLGVDSVRLQFCITNPGNQKRFSLKMLKETVLPFLNVLYNCKSFYDQTKKKQILKLNIEDKWIINKLNNLIKEVSKDLDEYNLDKALTKIIEFTINDFSRTYIKITRDREDTKEILKEILKKLSLLIAPYAPYISEYIYQDFEKKCIQLCNWPKYDSKLIKKDLDTKFDLILEIIEKGLAERDLAKIGLKWPLSEVIINTNTKLDENLQKIILKQLNVKKITIKKIKGQILKVKLNTKSTPELESEGYARVLIRKIQSLRKKTGLIKTDKIILGLIINKDLEKILFPQLDFIKKKTNAQKLILEKINEKNYKNKFEEKIKTNKINILFNKINKKPSDII